MTRPEPRRPRTDAEMWILEQVCGMEWHAAQKKAVELARELALRAQVLEEFREAAKRR